MFAMGIHGQNLFIDRANRIVVAKLSWKQRIGYVPLWATHRGFERLRENLPETVSTRLPLHVRACFPETICCLEAVSLCKPVIKNHGRRFFSIK
jgi:hypothetical protein